MSVESRTHVSTSEVLGLLDQSLKKEFDSNRRVLSFDEYLGLLAEKPETHLRGCAQYLVDMMDHFGKKPKNPNEKSPSVFRFKLFDEADGVVPKLIGQEEVQTHIYNSLRSFARQGISNKLVLLHGPNGSAKSTIAHSLMHAMERYSQVNEGSVYTFNWIFPLEKATKSEMGIHTYANKEKNTGTHAHLPDEQVASRFPCDLKDHPLLLIPLAHRKGFLDQLLGEKRSEKIWSTLPQYIKKGEPCHRCYMIFNALLSANGGNLKKVLSHVQVDRLYYSRRYRSGLVTIEPQLHVDAQYQMISYNKSISLLPASLQNLNLFTVTGDLVDGNRGITEYSDLLKRPVDSFKYLLGACEMGAVNVGSSIMHIDTLMIGSTNELQLDAFKEFPDFSSFKARIELIRVPYLLEVSQEKEIYSLLLPKIATEKTVAPHVAWVAALWSVLTRLKKPNSLNYAPSLNTVISNLTPLEKSKLYDTGEMPAGISPEDRKLLKSSIEKLRNEYINIPYYEGRLGASPREIQSILLDAAQNPEFATLSPLAVFKELEEFIKRVTEYEFLKQDVKDGYHDAAEFIGVIRNEYLNLVDREVRDCMGLYNTSQWEDFLKKYIVHLSCLLKKEKIKNMTTGQMQDPDLALIQELEKIVDAPTGAADLENFRRNAISQIGAWSLDHQKEAVIYSKVFPEFWNKIQKHYYEGQKAILSKMHEALIHTGSDKEEQNSEGAQLARQTLENMKNKLGYDEASAREAVMFLMTKRH